MENSILISTVGKTDPIRGEHDGPLLHIIRNYKPERVILILTSEIGQAEREYHHNEDAIRLLSPDSLIEFEDINIRDAHSYDNFAMPFLQICNRAKENYPGKKILLNITSGTPQMETAMCMIAISDLQTYCPIQVDSPERGANKAAFFDPAKDCIEDWFETDMDNEPGVSPRCRVPELFNFKRPIVRMQIESLIEHADYVGAHKLYEQAKATFSDKVGFLLKHAEYRLNLEEKKARELADKLGMSDMLYPVKRADINRLLDFFNSIKIKQQRGELNDFSMRLEIMAEHMGIYVLKDKMHITLDSITKGRMVKGAYIHYLSQEKCENCLPGISSYLDEQFSDTRLGVFAWDKPLNARSIIYILTFMCKKQVYKKFSEDISEMMRWVELSAQVRNPAAHTIIAIGDEMIRKNYGKDSAALCKKMQHVLSRLFGTEVKKEAFDIYQMINTMIKNAMSETALTDFTAKAH